MRDIFRVEAGKRMNKTKRQIVRAHVSLCEQIEERWPGFVTPRVVWCQDSSNFGFARHNGRRVYYNLAALVVNPSLINDIVAHELAHCVVSQMMGDRGAWHGARWRRVMMELGYPPWVDIEKYNKWVA